MHTPLSLFLSIWISSTYAYFADWTLLGGRPHEPACVDIPKNMSLCADIGYDKMRLPNLLEHDTLTEVQQQAGSWVPLLNVNCHPHTKLFLCSLFTPVCLESQIYPCRSLCESVQKKCETRMQNYGYHWPEMLRCDKFPEDNDMCIKPPDKRSAQNSSIADLENISPDNNCDACTPTDSYENIVDNFCKADIVLRTKIKRRRGDRVILRRPAILKGTSKNGNLPRFVLKKTCCDFESGKQKYLIMGKKSDDVDGDLNEIVYPTFVLPWQKSKGLKKFRRKMKKQSGIKCTDSDVTTFGESEKKTIREKNRDKKKLKKLRKEERKKGRKNKNNQDEEKRRKNKKRRNGRKNNKKEENPLLLEEEI